MKPNNDFKFDVDVNVINHLGVGLYSSTPAALTELVANAWDSDASEVKITLEPDSLRITIEDDGHGMDVDDVKNKFLKVGYSRRKTAANTSFSDSGNRRVMGRKGIGKLAMFALANNVQVSSQKEGSAPIGFEVDVPVLKKELENHTTPVLTEFDVDSFQSGHGTKIVLNQVLSGLKTTEEYLRVKLARRFSIIDDESGFKIILNGKAITKDDRGFYKHVQFLWAFDEKAREQVSALATNIASVQIDDSPTSKADKCVSLLSNKVSIGDKIVEVSGYIASVEKPRNLGSKEDSANMISIFANGRVFAENVLSEANSAKYYQSYLVGEVHADFLDADDVDRATASREAIKRDDPKYSALIGFIRDKLDSISDEWDEWRIGLGFNANDTGNAGVNEWLETLTDNRDKKAAKKLMASIKNATIKSNDDENEKAKAILYRGAIVGFEKLRLKQQLERLDTVTDVLSAEFAAIFATLNDVEEASYSEITKQRLEVIKKFKNIADDPSSLEKVAQNYLFEHLWLLDPSWDRVTGRAEMEVNLTEYIKEVNPDSTGARLDITYRASSGRHVIVELKRPRLTNLSYDDLSKQIRKYRLATEQYYRQNLPKDPVPEIDIYLLLGATPVDFSEADRQSLLSQRGQIITYKQLIKDAVNAYQEYWDAVSKNTGKLDQILKKI